MCGICGFFSEKDFFSQEDLRRMTSSIGHRGPDAEGFFTDNIIGLGHRRLSIIDLSPNANQPMHSLCNRYVIVYNGEVYNFKELRNKLEKEKKIQLRTSSDTEIVLEFFVHYGHRFIYELNGMFAFAIYDKYEQRLLLYRDRIGIKPLYYYWDGINFAFASELKSLKELKQISKVLNKEAVNDFLHLGYIPSPKSIFANIHKLNPGHWMNIAQGKLKTECYWKPLDTLTGTSLNNESEAIDTFDKLLTHSINYQLTSDVSIGTFLSGGIDSSLITAIASKQVAHKLKTFSIGFEDDALNEAKHAKTIANFLHTDHHEVILSHKNVISLIDETIDIYDEPLADSSTFPTMIVSKLARENVTVCLSGDGGDELFLGYGFYKWAERLHSPFIRTLRRPITYVLSNLSNRYKRASTLFDYNDLNTIKSHIFSQEQYLFSQKELISLLRFENSISASFPSENMNIHSSKRTLNSMEEQAVFDIQYYLPDDLLTKVDRASMFHSLEVRVPYLDHDIVKFALNLSPQLKYKNGVSKYLLKQVLYKYIPQRYFNRPKQGFSIPLNIWLKNELKYLVEDVLTENIINKFELVNYPQVKLLKEEFFQGKSYLYNRIWTLVLLHKWCLKNIS